MAQTVHDQIEHDAPIVAVAGRDLPVLAHAEVVVAGGGPAGAIAAIAAGRRGAQVLLLEAQPLLGGIGTSGGIQAELDERDAELGARLTPQIRGWHYAAREVNFAALLDEAGVTVWLRTLVTGVVMDGATVTGVVVTGQHGLGVVTCDVCVDATGDGDVATLAGADFALGREGDELQMAYSMTPGLAREDFPISHANYDAGWVDPTDPWDYTRGFVDGRKFLWREPYTSENRLYFCGANLGLRESRLVVGDYVLTHDDLFFGQLFSDTVGRCRSHYDNHARDYANEGRDARVYADVTGNWKTGMGCDVPYRSLLTQGVDGLLVAGRCISMTHDAEQALRMMKDMHRIGEAAGTAAALAARDGVAPRAVDIVALQAELVAAGIIGEEELAESREASPAGPRPVEELIAELSSENPSPAMWGLYRTGEPAFAALNALLTGDDAEAASWAALVLGAHGQESAREKLLAMVRDRDATVPQGPFVQPRYVSALICLGEMGGPGVAELIASVLEDETQFGGRWLHAMKALASIGDASVVPSIKELLERLRGEEIYWAETSEVKKFSGWKIELVAAETLIALGDGEGEAIARAYLDDPRLPVRRYAARILGEG